MGRIFMKILKKISKKLCQVVRLLHYIREARKENQKISQQNEELKKDNYRLTIENEHLVNPNKQLQKNLYECLEEMPK